MSSQKGEINNSVSENHSTVNLADRCFDLFLKNGIEIYKWQRKCWKCKQSTNIISYYLYYNAGKLLMDEALINLGAGIGSVDVLDYYLSEKYANIKIINSKTTGEIYMANVCEHCGATQGHYYTVEDPEEILNDILVMNGMDKYIFDKIDIRKINLSKEMIIPFFDF